MSDEPKKPEKLFFDEKTGITHSDDCPKTKKEFGEGGDGECALEEFFKTGNYLSNQQCASSSGPAQVASRTYRDGHDRIFGTQPTVGKA